MVDSGIPNGIESQLAMRPALLVDAGVYRDYAAYLRRILVGMAGMGINAAVVCPGDIETSMMHCPTVECIEHPALRLCLFKTTNQRILLDHLSRFKPSLIHTFSPGQVELGAFLSDALEVPLAITFHGQPGRLHRHTAIVHQAARLLTPSDMLAEKIAALYPAMREKIDVIPIGSYVEDSCACFERTDGPASLIASHPLNDARLFEPLLAAVRHLILDGYELMLVLMGQGRGEQAIRRHIRAMGLTPAVTIVPPMRPMRPILAGADLFLHLKDLGVYNAQLLEAMGVGLAVAGAADKTSGLLTDEQTAVLWDETDELSIYGCLKRLLGQRDAARQLAVNAQRFLRQRCSVSCMVDQVLAAYTGAMQYHKHQDQKAAG